jgi:hypothetical protein
MVFGCGSDARAMLAGWQSGRERLVNRADGAFLARFTGLTIRGEGDQAVDFLARGTFPKLKRQAQGNNAVYSVGPYGNCCTIVAVF